MKDFYVSELKNQPEIIGFYMVKSIALKTGANKKQYIDMTLGDKTGEITAKKWDVSEEEATNLSTIKDGDIIKVKAGTNIWQGVTQLRVTRIRRSSPGDNLDINDFIKAAPEKSEDMYNYIWAVAENMKDQDFSRLCCKLLSDNRERLMYYPAASKNHHAEYGGLLYHVKRMLMSGIELCKIYTNLNRDLVCTGVIIHDIEKLTEIESNEYGVSPGYSFEGQLLGHIVQGTRVIDNYCQELGISREKAIMLEHMILSHHYEPEFGSPKKPMFPEAELLHYLDVLDARMFDMEEALKAVEPGNFSERIRSLENRKVYKPVFQEDNK